MPNPADRSETIDCRIPGAIRSGLKSPEGGDGAGAYKFANVRVYAFALDYFGTWQNTNVNPVKLPKPLASSTTDGDGRFSLRVPAGPPVSSLPKHLGRSAAVSASGGPLPKAISDETTK